MELDLGGGVVVVEVHEAAQADPTGPAQRDHRLGGLGVERRVRPGQEAPDHGLAGEGLGSQDRLGVDLPVEKGLTVGIESPVHWVVCVVPIECISQSEEGFEKTFQGWSIYFMQQCGQDVPEVTLRVL